MSLETTFKIQEVTILLQQFHTTKTRSVAEGRGRLQFHRRNLTYSLLCVRKRNLKKEELREKMKRILFIYISRKFKAALLYNRVKWLNQLNEKAETN